METEELKAWSDAAERLLAELDVTLRGGDHSKYMTSRCRLCGGCGISLPNGDYVHKDDCAFGRYAKHLRKGPR